MTAANSIYMTCTKGDDLKNHKLNMSQECDATVKKALTKRVNRMQLTGSNCSTQFYCDQTLPEIVCPVLVTVAGKGE